MTENELRLLISKSQKDGFRELFRHYYSYVYSVVWRKIRLVGRKEDAEECLSDIFAQIFLHFDEIKPGMLTTYISTVAGRMAIDKYRSLTAMKNRNLNSDELCADVCDDENIEEKTETAQMNKVLLEKIISLGEPDSTIIIHRFYYERTSSEIAKYLGISSVNVRMRLSRSLKRLKKLIINENEESIF